MDTAPDSRGPASGPKERRFGFRLWHFLVLLAALSIPIARWSNSARRQRDALQELKYQPWIIQYDFELTGSGNAPGRAESWVPSWLLSTFGPDFFHNVIHVDLHALDHDGLTRAAEKAADLDATLHSLAAFPHLESLVLNGHQLTDEHLETLARQHPKLELLQLSPSTKYQGIPAGKSRFRVHVESIGAGDATFGDEGIARLARLKSLRSLAVTSSHMTDESLRILGEMPSLRILFLRAGNFTDAGLARLHGLKSLLRLTITENGRHSSEEPPRITKEGEERLKAAIPTILGARFHNWPLETDAASRPAPHPAGNSGPSSAEAPK